MVPAQNKQRSIMLSLKIAGCLILVLGVAGLLMAAKPGIPQDKKDVETCGQCHENVAKGFLARPHAALGDTSCTACHAGSDAHLKEGGGATIFAFRSTDPTAAKNKACLTCHAANRAPFMSGPHGKGSLDCTSCHSIHGGSKVALLKGGETKTCSACHQDVVANFSLNERHRLQEGVLACSSCHDAHSGASREKLGGFKQQACLKCHVEKGGPFLYEHGASRVEGCTVCHEVHGSPNRHMLTIQSVGDLCYSCHVFTLQGHSHEKTTNCVSCHSTIHGSNLSRIFIK